MGDVKRYWPLGIPFAPGVAVICALLVMVSHASDGTQLEGALMGEALIGIGFSLIAFPLTLAMLMALTWRTGISYRAYCALLFVATIPVAYFQCMNVQTSIMPIAWGLALGWLVRGAAGTLSMIGMNTLTYVLLFLFCSWITHRAVRSGTGVRAA